MGLATLVRVLSEQQLLFTGERDGACLVRKDGTSSACGQRTPLSQQSG
jgi:hypothetical protein